jgi:hypothetical protein
VTVSGEKAVLAAGGRIEIELSLCSGTVKIEHAGCERCQGTGWEHTRRHVRPDGLNFAAANVMVGQQFFGMSLLPRARPSEPRPLAVELWATERLSGVCPEVACRSG